MERSWRNLIEGAAAGGLALLAACSSENGPTGAAALSPRVMASSVAENPHNVISAVVAAELSGAVQARVEFGPDGTFAERTPDLELASSRVELPVLGLLPERDYRLRVVATSQTGDTAIGPILTFRTGTLPTSIPQLEIAVRGGSGGYTLLSVVPQTETFTEPSTVILVDSTGRVVWYREAPAVVLDFQRQPNGHYTAAVARNVVAPFLDAVYEEWDALGNVVGTWAVAGNDHTDFHELRLVEGGSQAVLLGFVSEMHDLRPFGGPASDVVVGNVLQRVTRGGSVLFEWNTFDHYPLEEADDYVWPNRNPAGYDHTHANAVEILPGGDYLLSTRHFSEVTRIDGRTGAIVWRMGKGKGNQFTFLNDPLGGFSAMHSIRHLPNGNLLLVDNGNGHVPQVSRAVEYAVDESARTATLVWSFEPGAFSCCMGFAQRLANGNTLVNLGQDPRIFEVSPGGDVVWEARLRDAGAFGIYRAQRVASLYGGPPS